MTREECANSIASLEDFRKIHFELPVDEIHGNFWLFFVEMASKAEDSITAKIYWLLSDLFSMRLQPSSNNNPFIVSHQENKRSLSPDDFKEDDLIFFESVLDACNDFRLKARIADLLWLLKKPKNVKFAQIAIENYKIYPIKNPRIYYFKNEIERAIRLSLSIKQSIDDFKNILLDCVALTTIADGFYLSKIAELINIAKPTIEEQESIILKLEQFAKEFEKVEKYREASMYYQYTKEWAKRLNNNQDNENTSRLSFERAKIFILQANNPNNSGGIQAFHYENALAELRCVATQYRQKFGVDAKILEIENKIRGANMLTLEQMHIMQIDGVDISEFVHESEQIISGKTINHALLELIYISDNPTVQSLKNEAEENFNTSSIHQLVGKTYLSQDGRTIGRGNAINLQDKTTQSYKDTLWAEMLDCYKFHIQFTMDTNIIPAYFQFLKEHRVTKEYLYEICINSPVVPRDRVSIWVEGLYFGFENNFLVATHLLIPQMENVIRINMRQNNLKTSTFKDGVETENGLSTLLDSDNINTIIGEDLLFELKALLTEQTGYNLRNHVAHGLTEALEFQSYHVFYLWWLCLKLTVNNNTFFVHSS